MNVVDLTKAFDTVSRGFPPIFIAMVWQFHDGMQARVQNDGEFSEPFEGSIRTVLAPALFNMMFSAMLMDAFQDNDTGFPTNYRFDGNVLNLRRLKAKPRVQTDVLDELLYADDMEKNASYEAKMKEPWIKSYSHVITMISQSAQKDRCCTPTTITVNGQKLKVVDKFTYLGSTLSRAVHIDD